MNNAEVKERLLERRWQLLSELNAATASRFQTAVHDPGDIADLASDMLDQETTLRIAEMKLKEVLQIEEALGNLDQEKCVRCKQCSEPISAARLDAIPSASFCVDCQEEFERTHLELDGLLPSINEARWQQDDTESSEWD